MWGKSRKEKLSDRPIVVLLFLFASSYSGSPFEVRSEKQFALFLCSFLENFFTFRACWLLLPFGCWKAKKTHESRERLTHTPTHETRSQRRLKEESSSALLLPFKGLFVSVRYLRFVFIYLWHPFSHLKGIPLHNIMKFSRILLNKHFIIDGSVPVALVPLTWPNTSFSCRTFS